jgi:hypothetical protein
VMRPLPRREWDRGALEHTEIESKGARLDDEEETTEGSLSKLIREEGLETEREYGD